MVYLVCPLDCPYGPREIINDGVTGLLARNGDVRDLAKQNRVDDNS